MERHLLLVDDEPGIVSMLKDYFEGSGYRVSTAESGQEALKKLSSPPDLILLDINLPDLDGLTLCRRIREHITCPILFLTARLDTADRIQGFGAGGDDYICKPFDLDELGARVEAHLRRELRRQESSTLRFFRDMVIDYSQRTLTLQGQAVHLSRTEFDILALLSLHPGQVFDRERIYELVWGLEGDGNSDTVMEHIHKIRSKLSSLSTECYIETVWGVGYRWNG